MNLGEQEVSFLWVEEGPLLTQTTKVSVLGSRLFSSNSLLRGQMLKLTSCSEALVEGAPERRWEVVLEQPCWVASEQMFVMIRGLMCRKIPGSL